MLIVLFNIYACELFVKLKFVIDVTSDINVTARRKCLKCKLITSKRANKC